MITSQTLNITQGGGYGPACGGKYYEIYAGTKPVCADGWTYSRCTSCGQRWRTRTISENLPDTDTTVTTAASTDPETRVKGSQNAPEGSRLTSKGETE